MRFPHEIVTDHVVRGFVKDQIISEQICSVLNFPKKQRNIARISSLASKMGQIKKVNEHLHPNYIVIIYNLV